MFLPQVSLSAACAARRVGVRTWPGVRLRVCALANVSHMISMVVPFRRDHVFLRQVHGSADVRVGNVFRVVIACHGVPRGKAVRCPKRTLHSMQTPCPIAWRSLEPLQTCERRF